MTSKKKRSKKPQVFFVWRSADHFCLYEIDLPDAEVKKKKKERERENKELFTLAKVDHINY